MEKSQLSIDEVLNQLAFWKEKAEDLELSLQDLKEEFNEFAGSSKDLEIELEAQLSSYEKRMKDMQTAGDALIVENELLKNQADLNNAEIYRLQEENAGLKASLDGRQAYIRTLEQINDDLERNMRVTMTTLQQFEARCNETIEKNAFLQSEKEELIESVQRCREEFRDLQQEMEATRTREQQLAASTAAASSTAAVISSSQLSLVDAEIRPAPPQDLANSMCERASSVAASPSFTAGLPNGGGGDSACLTPAVRLNALNAVGSLMRTVGAIESRLAFVMNSQYRQPLTDKNCNPLVVDSANTGVYGKRISGGSVGGQFKFANQSPVSGNSKHSHLLARELSELPASPTGRMEMMEVNEKL